MQQHDSTERLSISHNPSWAATAIDMQQRSRARQAAALASTTLEQLSARCVAQSLITAAHVTAVVFCVAATRMT